MISISQALQFTEGNPNSAKLVLVGEAHGLEEERRGQPFVGPTGELLDQILHNAGVARSSCYVTNVVKTRPPNNNIEHYVKFGKSPNTATETDAFKEYKEILRTELAGTNAKIILALGRIPLWALCGQTRITSLRGSLLQSTLLPGRWVLPSLHPASALTFPPDRDYLGRYTITADIRKARKLVEGGEEITLPRLSISLTPSLKAIRDYFERICTTGICAFDIETIRGQVDCISFSCDGKSAIVIPFLDKEGNIYSLQEEAEVWLEIRELLSSTRVKKVAQFGVYDTSVLTRCPGIMTRNIEDTAVGFHLLYPDLPKSLEYIASIYTILPYWKDELKNWERGFSSFKQRWEYCGKDSIATLLCWRSIYKELEDNGMLEVYSVQMENQEPLLAMQVKGIQVDKKRFLELRSDAELELVQLQKDLDASVVEHSTKIGTPMTSINVNSTPQMRTYFYGILGHKPYMKRGKRGEVSTVTTNDDALSRLARKGCKDAELVQRIRQNRKLIGTYFDAALGQDGRIRCMYSLSGTTTGRLASMATPTEGTNMQNQPPVLRQAYMADHGYFMLAFDLKQAEAKIVAYLTGDRGLIELFESGQDMYILDAARRHRKPVEEVTKEERTLAKRCRHARNYKMGAERFSLINNITIKEAKRIFAEDDARYPGLSMWHEAIVEEAQMQSRRLVNCFGRKRYFMNRWDEKLFDAMYAFKPQSTVADIMLRAIPAIYDSDRYDMQDVILLGQIHDELLIEFPYRDLTTMAEIIYHIRDEMMPPLRYSSRDFQIGVDVSVGLNWGKASDINPCGLVKLEVEEHGKDVERLCRQLHRIYLQYRASGFVPHLDGYLTDSISIAAEGSPV